MSTHSWNRWLVIWYFPTTFELRFRKGWYVYVIRSYGTAHWPASCFDYVSPWRRGSVFASWYQSDRLRVLLSVEIDVTMRIWSSWVLWWHDDVLCVMSTSNISVKIMSVHCPSLYVYMYVYRTAVLGSHRFGGLTDQSGICPNPPSFSFLKKERLLLTG